MGSKFESILLGVKSRKRFLNAVSASRRLFTTSLVLTAIYFIFASFKILPKLELGWLIGVNLLAGIVGFVSGYFQRIDLAAALYHIDRKLKLGEKLCTIYDLQTRAPHSDFLKILYGKIASLTLDTRRLFPFSRAEKVKLAGLVALTLLWALLALQYTDRMDFIGWWDRQVATQTPQKPEEGESQTQRVPTELEELAHLIEKLSEIRQSVEVLEEWWQEAGQSGVQKEALAQAAQLLSEQLESLQRSLLGQEPQEASTAATAKDRQELMQKLNEKLSQGARSEELSELLQSLAQNLHSESLAQELSEALQAQDQDELKKIIERLSRELLAIEKLQEKLRGLMASLSEQKEQLAGAGKEQGEPREEAGDTKINESGPRGESEAPKAGEEQEPKGQEPNSQAGKTGDPMPKQPSPTPPQFYNAPIRGLFPPTPASTQELPTKRAPIETQTTAQGTIYRVDYQKLEALLRELREELSPEMLEVIRAYFQLIAQQER